MVVPWREMGDRGFDPEATRSLKTPEDHAAFGLASVAIYGEARDRMAQGLPPADWAEGLLQRAGGEI